MIYNPEDNVYSWCSWKRKLGNMLSGSLVVLFVSEILPLEDDPKELHFLVGCIMYNPEKM